MNTVHGLLALPDPHDGAPVRYIATDFAKNPRQLGDVHGERCQGRAIFRSRTSFVESPFKLPGMVPRRSGRLNRFWVPFWGAKTH